MPEHAEECECKSPTCVLDGDGVVILNLVIVLSTIYCIAIKSKKRIDYSIIIKAISKRHSLCL